MSDVIFVYFGDIWDILFIESYVIQDSAAPISVYLFSNVLSGQPTVQVHR